MSRFVSKQKKKNDTMTFARTLLLERTINVCCIQLTLARIHCFTLIKFENAVFFLFVTNFQRTPKFVLNRKCVTEKMRTYRKVYCSLMLIAS